MRRPGLPNRSIRGDAVRNLAILLAVTLAVGGCAPTSTGQTQRTLLPAPVASASHPLAGFWKDGHCDDEFGLAIAPAGPNLYSVSFCGPGGCFEPGTYRPNTPIVGDSEYRVMDDNTISVSTKDGEFQRYSRCAALPGALPK